MTTQTSNEAAERLRSDMWDRGSMSADEFRERLDDALATERRALVARVEDRVKNWPKDEALKDFLSIVREAAR